ncbi:MAG: glycosyltransferase family 4 protein [Flavobacteriales bacterium]
MKISLITDGITPYVTGGMQKHSFCVARYMAREKINVDLYHDLGNLFPSEESERLEIFSDDERAFIQGFGFHFPNPGKLPGHYLRRSKEFSALIYSSFIQQQRSDFIIAKGFTPWELLENRPKDCPPIAVKFHGMNMFQTLTGFQGYLKAMMFRTPVRKIMRKSDYVFSYGGKITDIILRQGIPHDKILEFPSGIESDWLEEQDREIDTVKFLYVGRYERLKGVEELYSAIQKLPPDINAFFSFVGPIPESKKLSHPKVFYYNEITSRERLRDIYKEHDVVLCCSYSEGMPNVILEGMGLGLTALATDTGAVSTMVNMDTGWVIDSPPQPDVLVRSIVEICSDIGCLREKKRRAFEHVSENLRWEVIITRMIEKISTLI